MGFGELGGLEVELPDEVLEDAELVRWLVRFSWIGGIFVPHTCQTKGRLLILSNAKKMARMRQTPPGAEMPR